MIEVVDRRNAILGGPADPDCPGLIEIEDIPDGWRWRLTPRGADLVATADAIGYDPDAPECDACRDTGSVREWVDVPIMGDWTVTRERVRPCGECSAQAEADRATIETGLRSADGARPMRAVDPFPGYEYYSPTSGPIVLGLTDDASKSIADRDAIERGTLSLADFRERLNAAVLAWHDDLYRSAFVSTATGSDLEALLALASTPEPEVIDRPAPVDWDYLERTRVDG